MKIRFDVNDVALRTRFLAGGLEAPLQRLLPGSVARWGNMSAQQMVEHLLWVFEGASGGVTLTSPVPEEKRERFKAFLQTNRPTPINFENPVLTSGLPPLRFADLDLAIAALVAAARRFTEQAGADLTALRTHPLFGPLDAEGWARTNYKHCVHHFLQFGLLEVEDAPGESNA